MAGGYNSCREQAAEIGPDFCRPRPNQSYADWKGILYPHRKPQGFHEASYLAEYFDTIEINTSFYQPLKPENCVKVD